MEPDCINVLLADDNVLVGEAVRSLLEREADLKVVDAVGAYDEFIAGAEAAAPQVLVTHIPTPPASPRKDVEAAKELRAVREVATGGSMLHHPKFVEALVESRIAALLRPAVVLRRE